MTGYEAELKIGRRPRPVSFRLAHVCLTFLCLLVLDCLCSSPIVAQSGRVRPQAQGDQPIRLRTEEVLVPVSVRTDSGKLPTALSPSDLIVVEDNSRRTITGLMRTPVSVVLIVDSCLEYGKFKDVNLNRDAAIEVIDSLGEADRAAVVTYADKVAVLAPLTNDKQTLRDALTEHFKVGVKSHLYESILLAAQQLADAPGRHSVVVFTDGYDDFPRNALDKAKEALDRARVTVYIVDQSAMIVKAFKPVASSKDLSNLLSLGLDPKYREMVAEWQRYIVDIQDEERTMKNLAEDSGGEFWNPVDPAEFAKSTRALVSSIGSEYVLAYSTERERGDTSFHDLRVYPGRPGLSVKVRHGVY